VSGATEEASSAKDKIEKRKAPYKAYLRIISF
jgi:hypothetical protein